MSASEPDDRPGAENARAYRELATLVRHVADELAGFRRRAFAAESRLREIEEREARVAASPAAEAPPSGRIADLERENAELRRRLEQAGSRTRQLLERVRFLRQQHVTGG